MGDRFGYLVPDSVIRVRLNQQTRSQADSPVSVTYALLDNRRHLSRPFLDLAQAAPQYPPAPEVAEHIAGVARSAAGAGYVDIAGLPGLREAFAAELSDAYRGGVHAEDVVITAGCNQAFCLVMSALAEPGDEVVLALPYYFNHDMWLRMTGIVPRYLEPGPGLVPSAKAAESLIVPRTRAIMLVSPGNPTGVTLTPRQLAGFLDVARRHDIALVLDETYRCFRDTSEPAHDLFADPQWPDTLVSLHSFSKDLAIPGYRVGAVVASAVLQREVMKLLDCVAICAPRIGQEAAWAGLVTAASWRAERAAELASKRAALAGVMAGRPGGFELLTVGGFFGWVRHPFAGRPTSDVVRELAIAHDILVMPGTAFQPQDRGTFRISVSNIDLAAIRDFAQRLTAAGHDLLTPAAGMAQ
jgi:aspartate/methionine/tyrosine aminotransferase